MTEPHWSESFGFWAYDTSASFGLWAHLQRVPGTEDEWQALVAIHLTGGEVLVAQQIGRARSSDTRGPGSFLNVAESGGGRWQIRHEGAARRVTTADLESSLLGPGPTERTSFDLTFAPTAAEWSLPGSSVAIGARGHQEQPGRATGSVEHSGQERAFAGLAYRDHSSGPRDFATVPEAYWVHGVFNDGSAFLAMESVGHQFAFVVQNGEYLGTTLGAPRPFEVPEPGKHLELDFWCDGHPVHVHVHGTYLDALPLTGFPPSSQAFGRSKPPPDGAAIEYWAGALEFRCNGRTGTGFVNASRPVKKATS